VDVACLLVCEDAHGQYVIDDQCEPIHGVWYVSREVLQAMFCDQPTIVNGTDLADTNP